MIRFFFEFENQVVQLPVNPQTIKVQLPGNNKIEEIINLGEINLLRDTKLKQFSFECFFPVYQEAPYVLTKGKFVEPQFYIDFFEKIRQAKKPCRFIINKTNVNLLVSIENFEWGLTAGDEDTHYSINLKEYRMFASKLMKIQPQLNQNEGSIKITPPQKNIRLKTGFSPGDFVIVNGKSWDVPDGDNSIGMFTNFNARISHKLADLNKKYRYHITTLSGEWLGWVMENQLEHQ